MPLDNGLADRVTPLREPDELPPPLPANVESEQALLGAIFINNSAYARVSEFLLPEHFVYQVHGRIFAACGKLIERGVIASPLALKNLFDQDGALNDNGGAKYLVQLAEAAVTVIAAEQYGRTILDLYQRRLLIGIGQDLVSSAYRADLDTNAERIADDAGSALGALFDAGGIGTGATTARSAGAAAQAALSRAESAYQGKEPVGVPSGIEALDRLTGGWQRGDLIYIGKRPSMGGTAFAITCALNAARAGSRVLFFSVEMSAERIGRRMLAWITGITTRAQRAGELAASEWAALAEATRELDEYPLLIDDTAPIGVATIRRRAKQHQRSRSGLGLVLIDYLQLVKAGDGRGEVPLRESVPAVSGALRDLAKELDVPVVCLAQLTPDIDKRDNKRPLISDVRWSHDAEQDAAVMAMLYREEYYLSHAEPQATNTTDPMKYDQLHSAWSLALSSSRGKAEIIIAKNRDDEVGSAHISFDGSRSLFTDSDERQRGLW